MTVVLPPIGNGYQAMERLLELDELPVVLAREVDGEPLAWGDAAATGSASSGRVIGVSGFRRRTGSPDWGISNVSSVPWASFTRLARPWFQVAGPVVLRQLNPYTPCASRVIEFDETGYVPGAVGRPWRTSWASAGTAGVGAGDEVSEDEEQAASDAASSSAAATRTDGSALRRR
jgi:hypothetical protein